MKRSYTFLVVGLLLIIVFGACGPVAAPENGGALKGNISISGAFAIYPLMTRWAEEFQRIHPGIRFDISSGGAGKGMEDVLARKVDIGMVSREITSEEQAQGIYPFPIAKDAVFALVNEDNPVLDELMAQGVSSEILSKIFITGEITTWGEVVSDTTITDEIQVYTRQDICGAAAIWGAFLGGAQEDLRGEGKFGDPGMMRAIQANPSGIVYNNLIYAYGLGDVPPKGTIILPIDFNTNGQADPEEILDTREKAANAVRSGLYPAPPSRVLYLVTNGPPEGIVQSFLEWILTDGQAYVEPSGYIRLPEELLESIL